MHRLPSAKVLSPFHVKHFWRGPFLRCDHAIWNQTAQADLTAAVLDSHLRVERATTRLHLDLHLWNAYLVFYLDKSPGLRPLQNTLLPVSLHQTRSFYPPRTQKHHTRAHVDMHTSAGAHPRPQSTLRIEQTPAVTLFQRKTEKALGGGSSLELSASQSSKMNTHFYPDIRRSFPTPHFSIFRQEQNVTVIRKLSKAGLEEPRRAKECAWISNTVAAEFFSFQRLS